MGPDLAAYRPAHAETKAREMLHWDRSFKTVRSGGFATGDVAWFPEGGLNASYNCVDRWAFTHPDRVATICEADEPGNRVARERPHLDVRRQAFKKGDTVSIQLPITWHAAVAFLACARSTASFLRASPPSRVNDWERGGKVIATVSFFGHVPAIGGGFASSTCLRFASVRRSPLYPLLSSSPMLSSTLHLLPLCSPSPVRRLRSSTCRLFLSLTSSRRNALADPLATTSSPSLPVSLTPSLAYSSLFFSSTTCSFCYRPPPLLPSLAPSLYLELHGNGVEGVLVLASPWPSITRTVWQDHARYMKPYPGLTIPYRAGRLYTTTDGIPRVRRTPYPTPPPEDTTTPYFPYPSLPCEPKLIFFFFDSSTQATAPRGTRTGIFGLSGGLMVGVLLFVKETQGVLHGALRTTTTPSPFSTSLVLPDDPKLTPLLLICADVINVSSHRLSAAEIESALMIIMHKGSRRPLLTGQAMYAFVTLKPQSTYDTNNEAAFAKELVLQIMHEIVAGEGDLSTVAEPGVVNLIKQKVAESA
ncbi:hypothetical protein B0H13DRAFT_2304065 [Mycena leptocephala]|nr:hypothetical protein B0H13DRAFT_2304065 [Mycena leptocephala]